MKNLPTIFHITHPKAGSQWILEILKQCAPKRIVLPQIQVAQFRKHPIKPGSIYPTVYNTNREEFSAIIRSEEWFNVQAQKSCLHQVGMRIGKWFHRGTQKNPYITFVVIRDLRDTLVSRYFSVKHSHPLLTDVLRTRREILQRVDKEQGLIYLMDEALERFADTQLSWLNGDDRLFIKYEDLVADENANFERIIDYCQINIKRSWLYEIIKANSFEIMTGRKRGQEDISTHQRKGIVGDWRNHFSAQIKKEFKKRFGNVLIKTGYEHDLNW